MTPCRRLRLNRKVVDEEGTLSAAAGYFRVSWPTAQKWAHRYLELGNEGMGDRASWPHSRPNNTSQPLVKKIVHVRIKKRLGPVQVAARPGMHLAPLKGE
ncbi:hypothetical protein SA2016_3795 [Sinomonas atrocyanea]|uniref:DNA-binding domain-containing protein n=1 Tax=Sinomonas atrocyanea TaxID=37927 RepID=A0A127A9T7_9MICC|nr:leucine zipper domain-containing protein [Sinomonas atrocyanea]AMM34452.1 hypothetical protein SA2016_3795 [Sinomonas atrocyanea]GEB65824.1 hypothetical protein SAT01_32720 [Sinomonas atrocyanea]GGG61168.1 hypothetical protein GCM10007172_10250 [Sinomonas atrocyanea]